MSAMSDLMATFTPEQAALFNQIHAAVEETTRMRERGADSELQQAQQEKVNRLQTTYAQLPWTPEQKALGKQASEWALAQDSSRQSAGNKSLLTTIAIGAAAVGGAAYAAGAAGAGGTAASDYVVPIAGAGAEGAAAAGGAGLFGTGITSADAALVLGGASLLSAAVGGGSSGGSKNTTISVPKASASENALVDAQIALAKQQLDLLSKAATFQQSQWDAIAPLIQKTADAQAKYLEVGTRQAELYAKQTELAEPIMALQAELLKSVLEEQKAATAARGTPEQQAARAQLVADLDTSRLQFEQEQIAQARRIAPLQEQAMQLQIEAGKRALDPSLGISEQDKARIDELTQAQLTAGGLDIDAELQDSLKMVRDELAPTRGLSTTDTPIREVADRLAAEALRAKGKLEANLRVGNVQAKLGKPGADLANSTALSSVSSFASAAANFQASLRQQADTNRALLSSPGVGVNGFNGLGLAGAPQLIGQAGSQGIGLATGFSSNPGGMAASMMNFRGSTAPQTTSASYGSIDWVKAAAGFMSGYGAAFN